MTAQRDLALSRKEMLEEKCQAPGPLCDRGRHAAVVLSGEPRGDPEAIFPPMPAH
jgi:hypothetical protein